MKHLPLLVLLIFVLSIVLQMAVRLFRGSARDKARFVVEYAQKRGYALVNPTLGLAMDSSLMEMARNPALKNSVRASLDIADIEGLDHGTGDWLAFTCLLRSKEVTIFNMIVSSQRADTSGHSIPYKVAKIKVAGLPRFSLGRNSALHSVVSAVGKITGKAQDAININDQQCPEFSKNHWVSGSDPDAVTAFLSSSKLRFLETEKLQGTLSTNANYLVYFEDGSLASEQDFDSFVRKAETIVANLL